MGLHQIIKLNSLHKIVTTSYWNLIFIFVIPIYLSCQSTNASLAETEEAIALAERFIKDNGYTNERVNKQETVLEIIDFLDTSIAEIFAKRYNTLHPKAFCILEDSVEWDIGFLRTEVDLSRLSSKERKSDLPGRCVKVNKVSKEVMMEHNDPLFSGFKKL